ncbi:MAG: tRNA (N6-isopentenyl adenosine(37)-C2)-methylthiotransferase MiaB [Candidatus Nealsonbacteria bacterium CG_4_10_14_0_2_um_filter_35_20]|nr:MAG: tRNA (N6-isopentenyl adenosine(37)-C2)-methylthiotransferase MiaB [Candidatus Nealsonbacteria bacterium CG_4_10_14_0_2_um_filter_35_20]
MVATPLPIPRFRSGWYGARINKMRYYIITYGCQMNKSDSERIATMLEEIGYQSASKENEADLIVVNMCSIRQSAVDRVYGLIPKFEKLKIKKKKLKTVLTGCILKEDKKKFKKVFDLILDIRSLPNWKKYLGLKTSPVSQKSLLPYESYYLSTNPKHSNSFSAFVPISNGCNNFCAYCVVPFTRRILICRDHKEILKEVKNVVQEKFKEIWLLGQNVNDYHSPADSSISFPKLLKMVNNIPGNFWLRFTSPHPKNFSSELIRTMARLQKVTPYLNLPVQSGDNKILTRMRRPYNVLQYKNLVKNIRDAFKKYRNGLERDITLSTDIIVGFPGETKKQFKNTVKLFKEIKFDMAYLAQYSPRPGTAAAKMSYNISKNEKGERWKILTEILKKMALAKNKKYIGKKVEVLVNGRKNDFLIGKSRHYKTVKINLKAINYKPKANLIGQFIKVKIIDATSWDLKGKLITG